MHKVESTGNVSNLFTDSPPGTNLEASWHNAIQEELAYVITQAGMTLNTEAQDNAGGRTQLYQALISDTHLANMGITATKTQINSVAASGKFDSKALILGSSTAGLSLRVIRYQIDNGTAANSIKVTTTGRYNSTDISAEDSLTKGGSTTSFQLDGSGYILLMKATAFSGYSASVPGWNSIVRNNTGTAIYCSQSTGAGIIQNFFFDVDGNEADLTALVDVGAPVMVTCAYFSADT